MADFPDDIMLSARKAAASISEAERGFRIAALYLAGELDHGHIIQGIAHAILSERERCRGITDDYDQCPGDDSPMGPVMAGQVQVAQSIARRIDGGSGHIESALTEALVARAVGVERKRSAAIARQRAEHVYDDCECLGGTDPETGIRECSLAARGHDCLCAVAGEMAEEIANEIEGGGTNG